MAVSPPTLEQKRLRQEDQSIVPSTPYLFASKILDITCDAPLIHRICPPNGWRSVVGEWGVFPDGKLSHSYNSHFGDDINNDVMYHDFMESNAAVDVSSLTGVNYLQGALANYYNFAFQTSSTTLCDVTNPLAVCVILCLLFLIRKSRSMLIPRFMSLGKQLGTAAHGSEWEHENQDRILKFGDIMYNFIFHSGMSVFSVWYFQNYSWLNDELVGTKSLWMSYPNHPVEPGMAWYYLIQCAHNVNSLSSLLLSNFIVEWKRSHTQMPVFKWASTVQEDFTEMLIHHIITVLLIIGSSHFRFARVGSMVCILHELSEIPVSMSKLANCVKWKVTTEISFTILLVTWVVLRLWIFPFVIFKSVLMGSYEYLVIQGTMDPAFYKTHVTPLCFLLGGLIMLHVMWFFILLKIGWVLASKGERHDYTEYKHGEIQSDKKQN